ncbi:hypothetical protein C8R45DRAFT_932662 [Mycena sanguinolenta]|nr:hypothetical protein C8R45DRAFT_932662 [Mycena sanguinolenta]
MTQVMQHYSARYLTALGSHYLDLKDKEEYPSTHLEMKCNILFLSHSNASQLPVSESRVSTNSKRCFDGEGIEAMERGEEMQETVEERKGARRAELSLEGRMVVGVKERRTTAKYLAQIYRILSDSLQVPVPSCALLEPTAMASAEYFNKKEPIKSINPDEVVAYGAAAVVLCRVLGWMGGKLPLYLQAISVRLANLLACALTDLEAVRGELASMRRLAEHIDTTSASGRHCRRRHNNNCAAEITTNPPTTNATPASNPTFFPDVPMSTLPHPLSSMQTQTQTHPASPASPAAAPLPPQTLAYLTALNDHLLAAETRRDYNPTGPSPTPTSARRHLQTSCQRPLVLVRSLSAERVGGHPSIVHSALQRTPTAARAPSEYGKLCELEWRGRRRIV